MDSLLAYKCDVAPINPPIEPLLQVMFKINLEETLGTLYRDAEYERASHMALDPVGGMCIDVQLHMQPCFP